MPTVSASLALRMPTTSPTAASSATMALESISPVGALSLVSMRSTLSSVKTSFNPSETMRPIVW